MRRLEVLVLFLLLSVVMVGLSTPLWWNYAQPYILGLPGYIDGIVRDIKNFIDSVMTSIKVAFVSSIYSQNNFNPGN
ncbi:MAG: hypothetical protein OIN88_00230 [Candidatus Methanoperedens sp.]|nr:hypothetical protein [Candidatus Methanoperedens sp.]